MFVFISIWFLLLAEAASIHLLQHFHVEDRVCLEAKVAKIWLKFEAAQATCRDDDDYDDDDDDDHISSQLIHAQHGNNCFAEWSHLC